MVGVREHINRADCCDFIFLGVKPGMIRGVLAEINEELKKTPNAVTVTRAAGVETGTLAEITGERKIIRIMPNTPVAVGCGMITWCHRGLDENDEKNFLDIMHFLPKQY